MFQSCSSFFLCLQGQAELCGNSIFSSLAFLSSSISMYNLIRLVATIINSLAFLSLSVSMANLSHLVAASFCSLAPFFFCLHGQRELFARTTLKFLSNSLSSPRFNLLRVARRCFSWSSVSDDLFLPSCVFLFSFLLYLFRVLSSAFLSSVHQSLKLCLL